jgi:hypothetical protein
MSQRREGPGDVFPMVLLTVVVLLVIAVSLAYDLGGRHV